MTENIAWALGQQIDSIEIIQRERLEVCRNGGILRLPDGRRMYWKGGPENIPTMEQREEAKKALKPYGENPHLTSWCPCCRLTYSMASSYTFVQEHGVCGYCLAYVEGRSDGVLTTREPTVEEALAVPPDDLKRAEALVFRAEVLRLRGEA